MPRNTEKSEEIIEIITAVPRWIIRSGMMVIMAVLLLIIILAAFVEYPDVIKTSLKINNENAPKSVIAHQSGKLVRLLVKENEKVNNHQILAFIESTGSHNDVLFFAEKLKQLKQNTNQTINSTFLPNNLNLGELQASYQSFYQDYLQYLNTQQNGFYSTQKAYLQRDIQQINQMREEINQQKNIQQQEYQNAQQEYEAYRQLKSKKVISNSEFRLQENKYLASKYTLQQANNALINNHSSLLTKEKEILALENTITEQQTKFRQALNSIINETEAWLMKYVIFSPFSGIVDYASALQENQNIIPNQELFIVNQGNSLFFGEIRIPQYNMGKIKVGQRVLVKLLSYPFEEYGVVEGRINFISNTARGDSIFVAKVGLKSKKNMVFKTGMLADAEIITQESSLLNRFFRNIIKVLNTHQ